MSLPVFCVPQNAVFFFTSTMSLKHTNNPIEKISIVLCAPFQLSSQNRLFLGIKILGRGICFLLVPPVYAHTSNPISLTPILIIFFSSTLRSLTWSPSLGFPQQTLYALSSSPQCYMLRPSHSSCVQILKLSLCNFLHCPVTSAHSGPHMATPARR
jgi:hypothetical protein